MSDDEERPADQRPRPPAARPAGRPAADALTGSLADPARLASGERYLASNRTSARATPRTARPLAEWQTRPRILVTNDDGIESRGLLMLKQALEPIGDVYVLAPETNQSAVGHSMTFMRPLRVRERTLDDGSGGWSVDGSPTDAVGLAFLGYFGIGFDLVASGINYGANLGDDVTYSGTVGAAMEAVLSGCPGLRHQPGARRRARLHAGAPGGGAGRAQHPRARPRRRRAAERQRACGRSARLWPASS